MKKLMIAALLVAGFAMLTSDAQAARRFRPLYTPRTSSTPTYNPYVGPTYQSPRPTFFEAFMEFERRKNAMLFGGW